MATAENPSAAKPKVLVVEDDDLVRTFVRKALWRDFEPVLAADGAQMRQQLGDHPNVAVILMDLALKSSEDGLALTRWLRADARWKNVPVIAATAYALPEDRDAAVAAGCTTHLAKPYSRRDLITAIRNALGLRTQTSPGALH